MVHVVHVVRTTGTRRATVDDVAKGVLRLRGTRGPSGSVERAMKTTRILLVVLLAGSGLTVSAPPALACSCAQMSERAAYETSDAVFIGTPIERIDPHDGPLIGGGDPIEWVFEVQAVALGRSGVLNPQSVYSERDGAACGYDFEIGDTYLVFAREGMSILGPHKNHKDKLHTGLCSGNHRVSVHADLPFEVTPVKSMPESDTPRTPGDPGSSGFSLSALALTAVAGAVIVGSAALLRRRSA